MEKDIEQGGKKVLPNVGSKTYVEELYPVFSHLLCTEYQG